MCPFKKAFPFVLLMHLLFAAGIFAAFAQHEGVHRIFTLLPALGEGEELKAGHLGCKEAGTPAAAAPLAEPAPKISPVKEVAAPIAQPAPILKEENPATPFPVAPSKAAVSEKPVAPVAEAGSGGQGSVAGSVSSKFARVGGAVGEESEFGGNLTPPVALRKPKPAHPAEGCKGQVVLSFTINAQGRVEGVSVERSPSPAMTDAVLAVLPKWRFAPARAEGKAIALKVRQVVEF